MGALIHLAKLIWSNTGIFARIVYFVGILLPSFLSKPVVQHLAAVPPFSRLFRMFWGDAVPSVSWPLAVFIAISSMVLWIIWGLAQSTTRLEARLEPKLQIEFKPTVPWVVDRNWARWMRIRIQNLCADKVAKDCEVQLRAVEYMIEGGVFSHLHPALPKNLRWSNMSDPPAKLDLPPDGWRHVDVIAAHLISGTDNKLSIQWRNDVDWQADEGLTQRHGTYRLTIATSADGMVGDTRRFIVNWTSKWDETEMTIEPK